jgi:hypothetical protein
MDGPDRRHALGRGQLDRQDQDGRPDDGDPDAAVPRPPVRHRYPLLGRVPAVDRGRADRVVDVLLPAPRLAPDQGKSGPDLISFRASLTYGIESL